MKNLNFLREWKISHRGLHDNKGLAPENSIIAFNKSIEHGFAIELDIQPSKDGLFVVYHDNNLSRLTNNNSLISSLNYDELSNINLLKTNEKIPLFTDVLNIVDSKVPLLIEIKQHKNYKQHLLNLATILDNYIGEFAVFSFDPRIVYWFKKNRPNYIRGQITSYFNENNKMPRIMKYLMKTLYFNKRNKPDFISYNLDNLPNKYANKAQNNGILVISYTAKNQIEYNRVLKNYSNVVFEGFIPKK